MERDFNPGAIYLGNGQCRFCVWAPDIRRVELHLLTPTEQIIPLELTDYGYHQAIIEGVTPGSLYVYRLDGNRERPDPASRSQPQDVHGPSQIVDPLFDWSDSGWTGLALKDYIFYELHVGTFSTEGTFNAVIPKLEELKALGITAIELMPVGQFPGNRNWGYDGVYPFAVHNSYGRPAELRRLVNACHGLGLAVVLDVVYNHLGPEGNYLADFAPYFTESYRTPWGAAVNFDGPYSDGVRNFFIKNALYWLTDFHIDAFRLDALHAIVDTSVYPFIEELTFEIQRAGERLNRRVHVIAESDRNDARLVRSPELGGYGVDACWNDDLHHALHVSLTGEQNGYYQDFHGIRSLVKALKDGFVYTGQYSAYRKRRHGSTLFNIPSSKLVAFAQNHDQVGNRMLGERLSRLVSFDALKLAAGIVLLSPFTPLLFMGEEYGETAPFLYFTSHCSPDVVEATREGRRREFSAFSWKGEPLDPQDEATFQRCKLNRDLRNLREHKALFEFYRELIKFRKKLIVPFTLDQTPEKEVQDSSCQGSGGVPQPRKSPKSGGFRGMRLFQHSPDDRVAQVVGYETERILFIQHTEDTFSMFNFSDEAARLSLPVPPGDWGKLIDSSQPRWLGSGSEAPAELNSTGEASILLKAKTFVTYTRKSRPDN